MKYLGECTPESAFKTVLFVALYAPVIDRRHSFCSVVNFPDPGLLFVSPLVSATHRLLMYVIARPNTAVYTCLALFNAAPHVEVVTLVSAIVFKAIFAWISLMWGARRSLPSIQRLSFLSCALGEIW